MTNWLRELETLIGRAQRHDAIAEVAAEELIVANYNSAAPEDVAKGLEIVDRSGLVVLRERLMTRISDLLGQRGIDPNSNMGGYSGS